MEYVLKMMLYSGRQTREKVMFCLLMSEKMKEGTAEGCKDRW